MDRWSVNASKTIYTVLLQPEKSQKALGRILKIKQNAVSGRLKRAHYQEVIELLDIYRVKTPLLR